MSDKDGKIVKLQKLAHRWSVTVPVELAQQLETAYLSAKIENGCLIYRPVQQI